MHLNSQASKSVTDAIFGRLKSEKKSFRNHVYYTHKSRFVQVLHVSENTLSQSPKISAL